MSAKFPQKISNYSIFYLQVKKISLGLVRKYPCQSWASPLFTAGQVSAYLYPQMPENLEAQSLVYRIRKPLTLE